ncbi:atp-dependent dna helicase pif1 [Trichoderma arundinaceum]|uniref:ATP-dependent DNA helicase n=1 Tax=Trichoderma arundinaceum TaxID=490622 RepID=A0A395NL13_TRIAR|nr:atp-dependent dna helicase pif1 [Trichoderma arundinaceum]
MSMLLVAPWRRSIFSGLASSRPGQARVFQQFPTSALYVPSLTGYSRKYINFWGRKKKAENNANVSGSKESGKSWFSKLWTVVSFSSKESVVSVPAKILQRNSANSSNPELSAEQAALVSLAVEGHNIFYTGSAGSGKSTVLKVMRDLCIKEGKVVYVLAPTGKVALANGGMTTWSFAGWTPNSHKMGLFELKNYERNPALFDRLAKVDVIIIDEISMMENVHFGRMNELMKAARASPKPFGGAQIIVTGDFCQLPPVKPFQHCFSCGSELQHDKRECAYTCPNQKCDAITYHERDKWAFKSKAWEECNFRHISLNAIYRQKDPKFIKLLQKCRIGSQLSKAEIDLLTDRDNKLQSHPVRLYATREEVQALNDSEFRRLKAPSKSYTCVDVFLWNKKAHPILESKGARALDGSLKALKGHRLDVEVRLKEGTQVALLHRINLSHGLCNGAQGVIVGFEPFGKDLSDFVIYDEELPVCWPRHNVSEETLQEFMKKCRKSKGWPIVKFHNGITRTIHPVCQSQLVGDKRPYSLLGRIQIPLTPAWALTIHKSQGMTLDNVTVNLGRAFEDGQIYVALSRARTLAGLKVEGDLSSLKKFRGNQDVLNWLKEKFGKEMDK